MCEDDDEYGGYEEEEEINVYMKDGYNENGELTDFDLNTVIAIAKKGSELFNKNILVPYANDFWMRFVPYWQSIAQTISENCDTPSAGNQVKFERTFLLKDNVGGVFSWQYEGILVVYIQHFMGNNSSHSYLFYNKPLFSIDSIILSKFFGSSFPDDDPYYEQVDEYFPDSDSFDIRKQFNICIEHDVPGTTYYRLKANNVFLGTLEKNICWAYKQ